MNKYEERVSERTDEFLFSIYGDKYGLAAFKYAKIYEIARISVVREADAYQEGYMSNFPDDGEGNEKLWLSNCEWEMIENGLIPPQTQTT